ncbi:ESX secretion-associated protein EspG [Amycolatopsis suaedae]|uniref:ESX secretion-associated protein EspG n=1 Tax=Amycolatopsis suaedae TaxID=2510978 RepID=A0A4V2EMH2_9PSEU|nr:ESX secretion-associated protein EspG [Amycolatopsis suaedae]RZQ65055.1 ESX secretion-associated protein EspG [Amycolatopsis suaedae]
MLAKQVTMSTGTLLNLIRRRGGEPHQILASTPTWLSEDAQRKENERADKELAGAGLAGRRGVDPGLLATVDAIARPQLEYYAWINGGYDGKSLDYNLLAGAAGAEGFVLARNTKQEGVVVASVHPSELLPEFIGQIPRLAAGKGNTLSVPKSELGGNRRTTAQDEGFSVMQSGRQSAGSQEADELRRVLHLPRLGGGSLYVALRNRSGSRVRVDKPVNYIDTSEGRWLTEETAGRGEPLIVFTPATTAVLTERLRAAQSTLGG